MSQENVSHGRGGKPALLKVPSNPIHVDLETKGVGNINPDDTPYTDGEIVREGPTGDQGDGAYSVGVRQPCSPLLSFRQIKLF